MSFINLNIWISPGSGKVWAIISLDAFSASSSLSSPGTLIIYRVFLLMYPKDHIRFGHSFFSFYRIISKLWSFNSQILSSVWSIQMLMFLLNFSFHSSYFSAPGSIWFTSVSVKLILFMYCCPDCAEWSVFSVAHWAFSKHVLTFFQVNHRSPCLWGQVLVLSHFLGFQVPQCLRCCLCVWGSSHILWSLLTSAERPLLPASLGILRLPRPSVDTPAPRSLLHPWQNSKGAFSQSCNALDWVTTASFALPGSGTSLTCRAGLAFCTCSLAVCQGVHYYQECTRKLAAQCGWGMWSAGRRPQWLLSGLPNGLNTQ